jgi:hypothetical protein
MSENTKNVSIDVWITELEDNSNLFQKWNNHILHKDFIENRIDKKHNMNSHTKWFNTKIKLNHEKEFLQEKSVINKWKICMVDYWMNIWTEINWIRPSIIFKNSNYKYWEDIIVIPMTSYKEDQLDIKSKDEFDVEIISSDENWLDNNSLVKIRQLRCISKKRFKTHKKTWNIIIRWEIEEVYYEKIEWNIKIMFWI